MLELWEARKVFEFKVAELAAQRVTAEDIRIIEESLNKTRKIGKGIENKIEWNLEFHLAVAKASHNIAFVNIVKLFLDWLSETCKKIMQIPGREGELWREHNAVFQAIVEHNSEKASKAMEKHLESIFQ